MRSSGYRRTKPIKLRVMTVGVVVGLVKMPIIVGQSCGYLFGWDEVMNLPLN